MTSCRFTSALLLLLAGCSFQGTQHPTQPISAPFEITPVSVVQVETAEIDPIWTVPTARSYSLKACLIDSATAQIMPHATFVLEGKTQPQTLTTDSSGCAYWTETVRFRFFNESEAFLKLERRFRIGEHSVPVALAADPWMDSAAGFVDLRTLEQPPQPIRENPSPAKATEFIASEPNLWIDTAFVHLTDAGHSEKLSRRQFDLRFALQAIRKNRQGADVRTPLSQGKLQGRLSVLETVNKTTTLLSRSEPFWVTVDRGQARLSSILAFSQVPKENGELELFLELEPIDTQSSQLQYAGVLPLKSLQDKESFSAPPVVETPQLTRVQTALRLVPKEATDTLGFVTEGSSGSFNGEISNQTNEVTVSFSARIRILEALTRKRISAGHAFRVVLSEDGRWPLGEQGESVKSNSDGEVWVSGSLTYSELKKQTYLKRFLLVRSEEDRYQGITRSVEIYINPWQRGALFYRDAALQGPPAEIEGSSRIVLTSYSAIASDRTFEINSHLQLTTLRPFVVNLRPQLVQPNPEGDSNPKTLRAGTQFHLTAVLSDGSSDPLNGFLAGFESDVSVDSTGEINAPVLFAIDFTQQPRLDTRTRIHFTLVPRSAEAAPATLTAPFLSNPHANDTVSGKAASPSPVTLPDKKHLKTLPYKGGTAYALKVDWPGNPLAHYADYWKGYGPLVTVADGPAPKGWTSRNQWDSQKNGIASSAIKGLWQSILQPLEKGSSVQVLRSFCSTLGAEQTLQSQCESEPLDFFSISQTEIVNSVNNPTPETVRVHNPILQLATSYFNELQFANRTGETDKQGQQWGKGATAKLGYELFGSGAAAHTTYSFDHEWFSVVESGVTHSRRSRVSIQESVLLSQEEIVLSLDLSVRTCTLIRPVRFVSTLSSAPKSFLLCSSPRSKQVEESWFSVRERSASASSLTDSRNTKEQGWVKLVRGQKSFQQFRMAIGDPTRHYSLQRIEPFFDGVDALASSAFHTPKQWNRVSRDGGVFPGVLRYHEVSPLQWHEGQVSRYTELCQTAFEKSAPATQRALGQAYCRCLYETASRRWEHEDYLENLEKYDALLDHDGVADRCQQFSLGASR